MPQDQVLHWRMDDNAANTVVRDVTGKYPGTAAANTSGKTATGIRGGGLAFDGAADYIDTGDTLQDVLRKSFSISVWIKPDDGQPAADDIFVGARLEGQEDLLQMTIKVTTGKLYCLYRANTKTCSYTTTDAVFADGAASDYYHVVMVADATLRTVSLYGNGALFGSTYASTLVFADYTSTENPYVGANNHQGGPFAYFPGDIDELMIFRRALSASEILKLYNGGKGMGFLGELDSTTRPTRDNLSSTPLRARYD